MPYFFSIRPTHVFRNNILQNALMAGNTHLISNKLSLLSPSYYCKKFKHNLDDFQVHLLDELHYRFNVIGVTETNITDPNFLGLNPKIPCYLFEYALTPLAAIRAFFFACWILAYSRKTLHESSKVFVG